MRFYQFLLVAAMISFCMGETLLGGTSVTKPDDFALSKHTTYAWDPAARNRQLQGVVAAELDKQGLREVANWREADILVGIHERRASYEAQLPPVERLVYDPYGPFYPQYPHTGYRRYEGHDPIAYELVQPGYRTEEQQVTEVTIFLRHNGDRAWRGSSWALTSERAEDLVKEIFDEL